MSLESAAKEARSIFMDNRREPGSEHQSGSIHAEMYIVEARVAHLSHENPVRLHDGILTESWRPVQFEKGMNPAGVPSHYADLPLFGEKGLPYESALALAWTMVAQHSFSSVQCRLVKIRRQITYSDTWEGIVDLPIELTYQQPPLLPATKDEDPQEKVNP